MFSPVSSTQNANAVSAAAPKAPPAAVKAPPQDSVHLSSQATGGGDVDHDGDSH